MAAPVIRDPETIARAADALLREHPDALVAGLASNGLIVPIPQTVGLWGQGLIEGRAVFDHVVAQDRVTVARMWVDLEREGATRAKVRMLRRPSSWATLHFLDVRELHGVVLAIVLPSHEDAGQDGSEVEELPPAAPRFCWLMEDEGARVLECDSAFTQMFGYAPEELLGKSVLDQIHPEDQGRAVEGWLSVLSTRRNQQTRLRRRRKDGTWVWVDTTLHNFLNEPDRNYVLVEIIDASAEMAAQEALQEREELLRRLTDAMPVGLLHVNMDGRVLYSNARLAEIVHGRQQADVHTASTGDTSSAERAPARPSSAGELLSTLTEEGMAAFDSALGEVLAQGVDRDLEVDLSLASGQWRRVLMSLRALLRQSGEVSGAITCVLDVTDSARARRELEQRATYDALTGCMNRSSILEALQRELEPPDDSSIAVIYVDLDDFKPVNDRFGHATGDELLALAAERMRDAARRNDDVGRLGGDEFLILLRDVPDADTAMAIAGRISAALRVSFALSAATVKLGASIGVACASAGETSADELVRRCDGAMYRAKDARRGLPVLDAAA